MSTESHSTPRQEERVALEPPEPFLLRAADRLYAECERAVQEGRLDARNPIADAALDYRQIRYGD